MTRSYEDDRAAATPVAHFVERLNDAIDVAHSVGLDVKLDVMEVEVVGQRPRPILTFDVSRVVSNRAGGGTPKPFPER